ncbi:MAG TPA: hypothetical protein DC024_01760 [Clostridiales bacterium]|jgi:hypothetical protein|uniref:DUF5018 domain-containing protein n=1 Tax=Proteiniphilum sp. UBA5510 TaxID=1947286 RepID=UPI000E7DBC22|nr:DUF5018 domain-containing protein [Proteiniphilum sp. UBA5510]HBC29960.1 hypothetical protein [Clostridiales bacterium]
MKTIKYFFVTITFALLNFLFACESPDELIASPTSGLILISAQFADESISVEQFVPKQEAPYGDTIRIQFPYYFPRGSSTKIDISRMRMTATIPVNVKIRPALTVMDLNNPNVIEVVNSDGTIDKHVIIGELIQ